MKIFLLSQEHFSLKKKLNKKSNVRFAYGGMAESQRDPNLWKIYLTKNLKVISMKKVLRWLLKMTFSHLLTAERLHFIVIELQKIFLKIFMLC